MKLRPFLALCCLILGGCISPESSREKRIDRSFSVFQSYPADVQKSLRNGEVQIGFDEDMVYFAMGSPHHILKKQEGTQTKRVWQYSHNTMQQHVAHNYLPERRQTDQYDTFDWDFVVTSEHEQHLLMEIEFLDGTVVALNSSP